MRLLLSRPRYVNSGLCDEGNPPVKKFTVIHAETPAGQGHKGHLNHLRGCNYSTRGSWRLSDFRGTRRPLPHYSQPLDRLQERASLRANSGFWQTALEGPLPPPPFQYNPISMYSCLGSSMNKGNSVRLSWWLCLGPWKGKKNEETILTTRSYPRAFAVLPDRIVIRRQLGQVPGFPKNVCGRILCGLWFSKLDQKKKKKPHHQISSGEAVFNRFLHCRTSQNLLNVNVYL